MLISSGRPEAPADPVLQRRALPPWPWIPRPSARAWLELFLHHKQRGSQPVPAQTPFQGITKMGVRAWLQPLLPCPETEV